MEDIIKIETLSNDNILLSGASQKILKTARARMYLKSNLKFELSDQGIIISRENKNIHEIIDDIKVLARYINCKVDFAESVNEDVRDYEEEEKSFEDFSEKARTIRNNHPDIIDFKNFEESLIKNMTSRMLYPLQMLSAYHLAFAQNACNFSVPGAGKTSVVYGAYTYLRNLPKSDPKHVDTLFIIGPLSSFGPWELEYKECFGHEVSSARLVGGIKKSAKENYLHGGMPSELTLTSYQTTVSIREDIIAFLKRNKTMLVLDEAHKIKNTKGAITANSVMELAQYAKARVVLTGTPAPNGYEDLYNLFKFLWPTKDIIRFSVAQLKNMSLNEDDSRIDTLLQEIEPFYIRVTKANLNLPPVVYNLVPVDMYQQQRDIYDIIEGRFMQELQEDVADDYVSEITRAKTMRLMQAATNPVLLNEPLRNAVGEGFDIKESAADNSFVSKVFNYKSAEIPAKFVKTLELVRNILNRNEKVVIWATFIRNIEMLSDYLNDNGIPTKALYGATPVETDSLTEEQREQTREGIVREFNSENSSFNVIIANPFAVAESISLHKVCHNAIYLERSFNAAHFMQSKDRIHRYGLKPGVITTYYFLVCNDSIDETIDSRLHIKEDRLNRIIESSPIPLFDNVLANEGLEDVKAIIKDYAARAKAM